MKYDNKPYFMTMTPLIRSIQIVTVGLFCFSIIALTINWLVYEFPGNNYLFYTPVFNLLMLFISFTALCYKLDVKIINRAAAIEYFIYVLFVLVLTFASTAIQYTPFEPIDHHIIALEHKFHLSGEASVAWLHQHVTLQQNVEYIYQVIGLELLVLPIAAILLKKYYHLYEYYFLILIATFLGYIFYYFFPTTGPASMFHSPYYSGEQLATGLKFYDIHHYRPPSTMEGGMIAMPSFHVIWACLTAYLMRFQAVFCAIIVFINILITISCVILGWHYLLDILGSFLTVILAFWIKNLLIRSHPEGALVL